MNLDMDMDMDLDISNLRTLKHSPSPPRSFILRIG